MKQAVQVIVGLVLCSVISATLIYSRLPIFWEHEDLQPHVYSITWRSGVMLILLLALTQGLSFLVFSRVRIGRPSTPEVIHGSDHPKSQPEER